MVRVRVREDRQIQMTHPVLSKIGEDILAASVRSRGGSTPIDQRMPSTRADHDRIAVTDGEEGNPHPRDGRAPRSKYPEKRERCGQTEPAPPALADRQDE